MVLDLTSGFFFSSRCTGLAAGVTFPFALRDFSLWRTESFDLPSSLPILAAVSVPFRRMSSCVSLSDQGFCSIVKIIPSIHSLPAFPLASSNLCDGVFRLVLCPTYREV